jgi:hypothetical protein
VTSRRGFGRRRLRGLLLAGALSLLGLLAPAASARAASPWWQLAAFPGRAVTRVTYAGGRVVAEVGGTAMAQTRGGFTPAATPPAPPPRVTVGSTTWSIDAQGRILVSVGGGPARVDAGSPGLGAGAHLIAAPRAAPGVVLAVSTAGVVWSRATSGTWSVSLVLLPRTLITGTPAITSLAAFSQSTQSAVVYLGTAGYGTLLTDDGGSDWTRASPGLPTDVLSLTADPRGEGSIWAGTSGGLYVHHLQALPTIPAYAGGSLTGRWLLTALVCALVAAAAGAALTVWSRRRGVPPARPERSGAARLP